MKRLIYPAAILFVFAFNTSAASAATTITPTNTGGTASACQPRGITGAAVQAVAINIQACDFSPSTITVPAGTTVTWTNSSNVPHSITALTAGGPSSGRIDPGKRYTFSFNRPGTYEYRSQYHQGMTGRVVVMGNTTPATTQSPAPRTTITPVADPAPVPVIRSGTTTPEVPRAPVVHQQAQTTTETQRQQVVYEQAQTVPETQLAPVVHQQTQTVQETPRQQVVHQSIDTVTTPTPAPVVYQTAATLPSVGPGNVMALFAATGLVGFFAYQLFLRRRYQS